MSSTLKIWICALLALSLSACPRKPPPAEVNLAIWGNYLPPELQKKFEAETGIKIHISNYSSNEELLAKVQMGGSGIDVAVPSDYMVAILIHLGLLEPLKPELLSNLHNVDPRFLKPSYDPDGRYSVPYGWSTTGIAVHRGLYKGPMKSWRDLLTNPELKGKISLLDDLREGVGAALKMNGASVNTTDPKALAQAKETLLAAQKNVKMFTSDTIDILKNKEVAAAQAYSTDALQAARAAGEIEYILPEEGGTQAVDNLVILKGAKHLEAAHKLIQFLLSPEAEKVKVQTIFSGPVLTGTRDLLPEDLKKNKALFPEERQIKKLEPIHDLGEQNKLYEDVWTAVKTQH